MGRYSENKNIYRIATINFSAVQIALSKCVKVVIVSQVSPPWVCSHNTLSQTTQHCNIVLGFKYLYQK